MGIKYRNMDDIIMQFGTQSLDGGDVSLTAAHPWFTGEIDVVILHLSNAPSDGTSLAIKITDGTNDLTLTATVTTAGSSDGDTIAFSGNRTQFAAGAEFVLDLTEVGTVTDADGYVTIICSKHVKSHPTDVFPAGL